MDGCPPVFSDTADEMELFSQPHPFLIGPDMPTIYPESELYQEIQNGNREEGELEKYRELRVLVENLNITTYFAAMGASNALQLQGICRRIEKND